MKISSKTLLGPLTLLAILMLSSQGHSIQQNHPHELNIDNSQLSDRAQSRDPKWKGNQGTQMGCTGLDFVVKSVKITRYTDRGTIGIHAKIKNLCRGNTNERIRVVFTGWPGNPHTWIHGLGRGETKGTGLVTDDNTNRNRAMGPVTIKVNHLKEIGERNYNNNTCRNTSLSATDNVKENSCR